MKRIARFLVIAVTSASLAGCARTDVDYFEQGNFNLSYPALFNFLALVAAGGVVGLALAASSRGSSTRGPSEPYSPYTRTLPSDERLKVDVKKIADFRGIAIHSFRYKGDERLFSGVIAQELLANPLHRAAVVEKDGFYAVDYAALGLQVAGAEQMMEAAQGAIARAGL